MTSSRYMLGLLVMAFAVLLVATPWVLRALPWDPSDDSLQRVQRAGVLRAGYVVGAPYATVDGAGEPRGIAVDAIRDIAAALGVPRVEWVQTAYAQLIPDLLDSRFDVVALHLVVSPDRAARVAFSLPVGETRFGVLVAHGNPDRVPPYAQLDPKSGVVIAVTRESLGEQELRQRGFADAQLRLVTDGGSGESTLRAGAAQGLVRTEATLARIAADHPDEFELVPDPGASARPNLKLAYAFRPDQGALIKAWNEVLRNLGMVRGEAR